MFSPSTSASQKYLQCPQQGCERSDSALESLLRLESPFSVVDFFSNSPGSSLIETTPPSIECTIFDLFQNSQACKTVKKVAKAWSDYASDRLGDLRYKKGKCCSGTEEYNSINDMLNADLAVVKGYKELLSGISSAADHILKNPDFNGRVRYIRGQDESFWCLSCFYIESDCLYLDKLATSAVSLPLFSPVAFDLDDSESVPVPVKGAGVLMMHSLCQTAQKLGLRELRLKSLDNSVGFYQKIEMRRQYDSNEVEYFSYDLTGGMPKYLTDYITNKKIAAIDTTVL